MEEMDPKGHLAVSNLDFQGTPADLPSPPSNWDATLWLERDLGGQTKPHTDLQRSFDFTFTVFMCWGVLGEGSGLGILALQLFCSGICPAEADVCE